MQKILKSDLDLQLVKKGFHQTNNTLMSFSNRHLATIKGGIQYIDEGEGIPLLFIHGTLANSNTWRKIIPILSKKYRCIAIDLPLGGNSLPIEQKIDLTPVGIAIIINQFIEYLNLDKVTIISNDTGGAYSQVFASLFPEKISKMIFSNCEVLDVFPPAKFQYLKYAVKIPGFNFLLSRIFTLKTFLKSNMIMGLLSLEVTNQELSDLYLKNFINDKRIRANFASAVKAWSPKYTIEAAQKLKTFENPILILWGTEDLKLFPLKLGQSLKEIFPNARLVEIANARTYLQEDQPDQTSNEIMKFIEEDNFLYVASSK